MFITKAKLRNLEDRIAQIEQKELCAQGKHKWEVHKSYLGDPPYVKCSACWAFPPDRKV